MSEDKEPDWMAELAKGSEVLRRQAESIVRAAEQFTAGGPARPLAQRITRAVDAAMRELLPMPECPAVQAHAGLATAAGTAPSPTVVTFSGGGALAPFRFSGQVTVENAPSGQAERSVGQILALVLLAIVTSGLLGVQGPGRATVDHYLTVLSFALPVAVLIWSRQNKQK